jgi:hypothetical protein
MRGQLWFRTQVPVQRKSRSEQDARRLQQTVSIVLLCIGAVVLFANAHKLPSLLVLPGTELYFGALTVNDTSSPMSLQLRMSDGSKFQIGSVGLVRGQQDFAIDARSCRAASEQCVISVVFRPKGPGDHTGVLALADTQDKNVQEVTLRGMGIRGPLAIKSFTANPSVLHTGESSNLCYELQNAEHVRITLVNDEGTLQKKCVTVSPTTTSTYTLFASDSHGQVAQKQATIRIVTSAIIRGFTANPDRLLAGQTTQLCYDVEGGSRVRIEPGIGPVTAGRGCTSARPSPAAESSTYTLVAEGNDGRPVSQSTLVTLLRHARILRFSFSEASAQPRQPVELCYATQDAQQVQITPNIGSMQPAVRGCVQVQASEIVYTLQATGSDQEPVTQTAFLRIFRPPIIERFTANPPEILRGQSTRLCYSVRDAESGRIRPQVGNVHVPDEKCLEVRPLRNTSYQLEVKDGNGETVRADTQVRVIRPLPPTPPASPENTGPQLPDLVATIRQNGEPTRSDSGALLIPIAVVVRNQGHSQAGSFKVTVENESYLVSFTVPNQSAGAPFVQALAAGTNVQLAGTLTVPRELARSAMSIRALADSCRGVEFPPEGCSVKESDETNNYSQFLSVRTHSNPQLGINERVVRPMNKKIPATKSETSPTVR